MLEHLADALVEEILNTSDEEILKEAEEDYGNPKQEADKARALYENVLAMMGKKRLLSAREALLKQKAHGRVIPNIGPGEARRKLETILKQHPEATGEFSLAARKGKDLSDEDILGMLEDLQDLGLYNPEDDQGDNS